MDPVSLSTITSAAVVLGTECLKGGGGEAGKDVWKKIKSLVGWETDPNPSELAPTLASKMNDDAKLAAKIAALLKSDENVGSVSHAVMERIEAKNVIKIDRYESGTINMG